MEKTKRVKVVTGLKCNIKCVFCYYRDSLNAPNRRYNEIIHDLLYARRHGISVVDFSGGEPTVHPDLPKLISEAKALGMEKECIISNGVRLSNREYLKTLKDAGLDEIHQIFIPSRTGDIVDWIADISGALIAVLLLGLILKYFSPKSEFS